MGIPGRGKDPQRLNRGSRISAYGQNLGTRHNSFDGPAVSDRDLCVCNSPVDTMPNSPGTPHVIAQVD
jgi:hypothetical protein